MDYHHCLHDLDPPQPCVDIPWRWDNESSDEPEPWVAPTGAHDAYQTGDRVTHQGQTWESTIDANVWEPGVHGWIAV